ncbi:MAG: hypothetical protein HY774_16280 [Acidobacteria bacterium]|nr:hypothetical protein [Acidobacteriota bacterium]
MKTLYMAIVCLFFVGVVGVAEVTAQTAHDFPCDWKSGFAMDPSKKARVGYLISFEGFTHLKADIEVFTPYANNPAYKAIALDNGKLSVVGILESLTWSGGKGDPLVFQVYVSQENASQLKNLMEKTLSSTSVNKLGLWILNFDEEAKSWYEEFYPVSPDTLNTQINAPGGKDIRLHVADSPTKISPNIDVNVYKVEFEVVPGANQAFTFHNATSSAKHNVLSWGMKVGQGAALAE